MLDILCGEWRACDRRKLLEDVCKLTYSAGVKTRCWCVVMPDRYAFVHCGVDDMASVDVDEKVIAAKEVSTQHRPVHISQYERPHEFTEAKVE